MKTSENDANRMLAKVTAFPSGAGRGCAYCAGLFMLIQGLVACSHRSPDRAAVHAKTLASESYAMAVAKPQVSLSRESHASLNAPPTTYAAHASASVGARTMLDERSGSGMASSLDRVVGDASVTLGLMLAADIPLSVSAVGVNAAGKSMSIAGVVDEKSGFNGLWALGALALIATVGAGLVHYLRKRSNTQNEGHGLATVKTAPIPLQDYVELFEDSTRLPPEFVSTDATTAVESTLFTFSSLTWSYRAPDYERNEHWDMSTPVDFLTASMSAHVSPVVQAMNELFSEAMAEQDTQILEEGAETSATGSEGGPLSDLFDQLEAIATRDGMDIPALFIERDSALPNVIRTSREPVPSAILAAWERSLRKAMPDANTLTLPWLLISTLLLQADEADQHETESFYEEAGKWVDLSMASDVERSATWLARHIDIDLRRTRRQKGAARVLSLRSMQSRYAQALARGEPPLLFAWIDVLMFWAECQFGNAALARYAEAEAMCIRVCELPDSADIAQRRRAEILRRRATIEEGGARLKSLDTAQTLLDLLYERVPSGDNALAVAVTALARGNVLPSEQAKEAYSHALTHAFMAEGVPHLRAEGLQCRLAVQWAYENLPGIPVQSDVAIGLASRLEALHVQHPDTVQCMAQVYLRHADFAHATALCEKAWRNGRATPALLTTWQEACRRWASASTQPEQLMAQQQAMRQLSIANAMR